MPTTRRQSLNALRENLPVEPSVLAHVLSSLSSLHGEDSLQAASAVCHTWHQRVADSHVLETDPDNLFGELRSGDKPHRFDRPHDAIFLPGGDICVADCDNFRLQIVSREGQYEREIKLSGGVSCPTGVAATGESLFVVEHGAHVVSKLRRASSSGHRHATTEGGWGDGNGQLRHPWAVAVANKRVYVTDQGNDRVSVFDTSKLEWLFSFGERGSGIGQFREPRCAPHPPFAPLPPSLSPELARPPPAAALYSSRGAHLPLSPNLSRSGVAIHGQELFVADTGNHRIAVFSLADAAGAHCPPVRVLGGGPSAIAGRFNGPSGLCIASEKLYVAELGGERLQVLSLDGLPLQTLCGHGPLSSVCADDELVVTTALEGDHAITVWRTQDASCLALARRRAVEGAAARPYGPP